MENNQENKAQDFKFIIVGGNEPTVNKEILEGIEKSGQTVAVFELTKDEMKFIINSRAEKKAEETAVDQLNDQRNIDRCKEWVKIILENHVKLTYSPKIGMALLMDVLDGKQPLELSMKQFKDASKLSWSGAKELFGSLDLFGFVKHTDTHGKLFTLVVSEEPEEVFKNKIYDLKQFVKLAVGKVTPLVSDKSATPENKKLLKSVKTRLSNIAESL